MKSILNPKKSNVALAIPNTLFQLDDVHLERWHSRPPNSIINLICARFGRTVQNM